jgi:hypothetical protein
MLCYNSCYSHKPRRFYARKEFFDIEAVVGAGSHFVLAVSL